jgi:hypothetical protein
VPGVSFTALTSQVNGLCEQPTHQLTTTTGCSPNSVGWVHTTRCKGSPVAAPSPFPAEVGRERVRWPAEPTARRLRQGQAPVRRGGTAHGRVVTWRLLLGIVSEIAGRVGRGRGVVGAIRGGGAGDVQQPQLLDAGTASGADWDD